MSTNPPKPSGLTGKTMTTTCDHCGSTFTRWIRYDQKKKYCVNECRLAGSVGVPSKREKYKISPEAAFAIKRLYETKIDCSGEVKHLARRLNLPRWKISQYAISQGWYKRTKKQPPWTDDEVATLKRLARYSPERIKIRLAQKGYNRTNTAIVLKLRRMRFRTNLAGQSACSLAECLGVDVHNVLRAIKRGRLHAERRGTARTQEQGGDAWYIKDHAIKEYITEYIAEIDFRKVDKWWLVGLLTDKSVD